MKTLCFGSFFKVLYQARNKSTNEKLFYALVFPIVGNGYFDGDKGTVDKYKKGEQVSSTITLPAQSKEANDIVDYYSKYLIPQLDSAKHVNIILAIKDLLNDGTLPNGTIIGTNNAYSKQTILDSNNFNLADILANVSIYCLRTPNDKSCTIIKDDYLDSFTNSEANIFFNENPLRISSKLSFTAKDELFKKTFVEINTSSTIPTSNQSLIKLYALRFANHKFELDSISNFIFTNLDRYVFSRVKRDEIISTGGEATLSLGALKEIKKANPSLKPEEYFKDIMLYSFLECALNAPKILSKVELDVSTGTIKTSSSGVHFLPSRDSKTINHQLIFGASSVKGNLQHAIDKVISQISDIDANEDNEVEFVNRNILYSNFDIDTTSYLKKALKPSRVEESLPDTSYGIFVGYSIDVSNTEDLNNIDFRQEITNRMIKDIEGISNYIYKSIANLGLVNHSFYFYFLPLINAENDKIEIMNKAIGE